MDSNHPKKQAKHPRISQNKRTKKLNQEQQEIREKAEPKT